MKLQGKKTGAFAGFIGWIEPEHAPIDPKTGIRLLSVQYKDAGVNCYKDYETIADFSKDWEDYEEPEEAEPQKAILEEAIAKLWREIRRTDVVLIDLKNRVEELENDSVKIEERLETTEESTERLLREDNERILGGKVKRYEPGIPPSEKIERMKEQLRKWIEKKPKIEHIEVNFVEDEKANGYRLGVQFLDADDNRELEDFDIIVWDWPRVGLEDGAIYTPDELLITGEAGKE